jgi:hypothetical protein
VYFGLYEKALGSRRLNNDKERPRRKPRNAPRARVQDSPGKGLLIDVALRSKIVASKGLTAEQIARLIT